MTFNERFSLFLKLKHITQKEFSDVTGYNYQSLIKFLTGQVESPKVNLLMLTEKHYPDVNIEWLLFGKGEMWNQNGVSRSTRDALSATDPVSGKIVHLDAVSENQSFDKSVFEELLKTKNDLIESQKAHIESLRRELENRK